jgi:hypothetical protein
MPRIAAIVALLVFTVAPVLAQWERVAGGPPQTRAARVLNTPHPLRYFLTFSLERYSDNSLCLGCKTADGQKVTLGDYAVEATQYQVGQSFGRKIIEIELTFHLKNGSVMQRLRREWTARESTAGREMSFEDIPPVKWKSIMMESSANSYRELYFIIDEPGTYVRPLEHARLIHAGGAQILATTDAVDGNGHQCTEGYWVLQPDGPWLLDFTPVRKEIAKISPPNAGAAQIGCWALNIEKLEVRTPVQDKSAECHACGWLGTAIVHFKIDGHSAVPVSSSFEHQPTN